MTDPVVLVWLLAEQDGAVLLGRHKPESAPFAGLWTLPGDAMHETESAFETIARFVHDQLDAYVSGDQFVDTLYALEDGLDYAVNVFRAPLGGHPRFRESGPYSEMTWAPYADIADAAAFPMPEALRALLIKSNQPEEGRSSI